MSGIRHCSVGKHFNGLGRLCIVDEWLCEEKQAVSVEFCVSICMTDFVSRIARAGNHGEHLLSVCTRSYRHRGAVFSDYARCVTNARSLYNAIKSLWNSCLYRAAFINLVVIL